AAVLVGARREIREIGDVADHRERERSRRGRGAVLVEILEQLASGIVGRDERSAAHEFAETVIDRVDEARLVAAPPASPVDGVVQVVAGIDPSRVERADGRGRLSRLHDVAGGAGEEVEGTAGEVGVGEPLRPDLRRRHGGLPAAGGSSDGAGGERGEEPQGPTVKVDRCPYGPSVMSPLRNSARSITTLTVWPLRPLNAFCHLAASGVNDSTESIAV